MFSPLVDWLQARTRLRRTWIVIMLYLAGLAATVWASTALVPLVANQLADPLRDMPSILTGLLDKLAFLDQYLLAEQIHLYGFTVDPQMLVNEVMRNLQGLVGYLTSRAIPAVFNLLEAVTQLLLYLIVTFYLLRAWPSLRVRLPRLVPCPYRREMLSLGRAVDRVVGAYIRGQLLMVGIMAAATFFALAALQVRYALTLALITGVLQAIPLVGPVVATAIAASVALFQPMAPYGWSSLTIALAVVLAYTVLRQIQTQLIVPNLVGPIVDLHPLLVLFALLAGGRLGGFTGLVVAVPVAAACKIVVIYLYGKIWDDQVAEAPPPTVVSIPCTDQVASGE